MLIFCKMAVRDVIRDKLFNGRPLSQKSGECRITDSGQPSLGWQGYAFIAVHGGGRVSLGGEEYYLHERHDFSVTISIKSAEVPRSRLGELAIDNADSGANTIAEYVIGAIHGNLQLWSIANNLIENSYMKGRGHYISKAPFLRSLGEASPVTGQWFGAKNDDRGTPCGVALEIRFGGLEMIRYISELHQSEESR